MRTKGISASSGSAEEVRLGLLAYLLKELPSANIAMTQHDARRGVHDQRRIGDFAAWSYGLTQQEVARRG